MGLLRKNHRSQGIAIVIILFLLMSGGLMPDMFASRLSVKKQKSPVVQENISFSKKIGSYFQNHMSYVAVAPFLHGLIEYNLSSSTNANVYIGRRHHLFFAGDHAPAQSMGAIYRVPNVMHFIDMSVILHRELAHFGAGLVIAIPPNAQSVMVGDLPSWAKAKPPFEYDLAVNELRKRDIVTVDLKSAFLSIGGEILYRTTDTHWTSQAAVIAYNLVVVGAGRPLWRVAIETALTPPKVVPSGDLARFLAIQGYLKDIDRQVLPVSTEDWRKIDIMRSPPFAGLFDAYAYERKSGQANERVLILGDSFTQDFWLPLFQRTDVRAIAWLHHGACTFDFSDIERFKPTVVILAPTERSLPCLPTAWPTGLPRQ